jgi:beta-barrel assembly-enhancing protease
MKLRWLLVALLAGAFCAGAVAQSRASSSASDEGQVDNDQIKDDQIKHDGGKSDVDAVGARNVGCNQGVGNWYSLEKQVEMGRSLAQQIEAQVKLVNDPVVTEYVNRIGQNLARNSDAQVPFTIKVIDSDVINAITLPGGFIYVNSGMILAADEEAEMAGAMAHEIAHVAACHAARQITRTHLMQLGEIPVIILGGPAGQLGYEIAGPAEMLSVLKFSRDFEAQADFLGIQYMYRAGYDPSALVSFFEKIQAMEKKKSGAVARMFDTHPQTPDRIGKTQKEIRRILPAKRQYVITNSEFDDIKARLAAVENKHKVLDEKDANKPVLRRTSNANDKDKDKSDDDRPTLKRHDDSNWRWLELGS